MPESLTPPQGLNAVTDRRPIYGLPLGVGSGGGGTKIVILLPAGGRMASGMKAMLIGSYPPAVYPPVEENPKYDICPGAGIKVTAITPEIAQAGAGVVCTPLDLTNTTMKNASGQWVTNVQSLPP